MYTPPKNLFLPRLGLALRFNDKTALRAGYARYAIPLQAVCVCLDVPIQRWIRRGDNCFADIARCAPIGSERESVSGRRQSSDFACRKEPGKVHQLRVQRHLGPGHVSGPCKRSPASLHREAIRKRLEVRRYVFVNLGHNFRPKVRAGPSAPDGCSTCPLPLCLYVQDGPGPDDSPNPFYQYLTPELFPGPLRNQRTVTVGSLLKPYPQYGTFDRSHDGWH